MYTRRLIQAVDLLTRYKIMNLELWRRNLLRHAFLIMGKQVVGRNIDAIPPLLLSIRIGTNTNSSFSN